MTVAARMIRFGLGLTLVAGTFALPHGSTQERAIDPTRPSGVARAPGWLGAASCAAAGCHNAGGHGGVGSEYRTWADADPHARAYEVLLDAPARRMMTALGLPGPAEANRHPACLGCHIHPGYDTADHHPRFAAVDGVTCESCHGPAERWVGLHYRPEWETLPREQKQARGMRDLRTVAGRATVCAACHVGAPGMEVNHDLIAAGHPRLAFEFSAYQTAMPHHWRDARDRDPAAGGRSDFDVQAWAVGQAVAAKTALDLLTARASGGSPWPEFAESDCFACHHDLRGASWRQQRGYSGAAPGQVPWNRWYTSELADALQTTGAVDESLTAALDALRRLLEARAVPDRAVVADAARRASNLLARRIPELEQVSHPPESMPKLFRVTLESAATRRPRSWDDAAQGFLALSALHRAWPKAPPALRGGLRQLSAALRYEDGHNSPDRRFPSAEPEPGYQALRKALAEGPGSAKR